MMTPPQTERDAPGRARLVAVSSLGSSDSTASVRPVPGFGHLVHGKHRARVVLIVSRCPWCGNAHQHVGQAGTVKRAPCGGGRYLVSVTALYDGRAS